MCGLLLLSGLLQAVSILQKAGHSGKVGQHTLLYLRGTDCGDYLCHLMWCLSSEVSHLEKP